MSIEPLANILIEDADIDEVEILFGGIVFDEARRNAIKRLDTFAVQAFPGTGKTTLLVAKLAILAKKWPYANRGICVLSHTNVAREEIETRLGSTEVGRKLLSYPHFIGTLHAFADAFIGLPWLKSKGFPISTIDTDITLQRRLAKLSYGAKQYFSAHPNLSIFACEAKDFPIKLEIKCGEHTQTYVNVKSVVEQSFRDGFFTYDEMLYIARFALTELASFLPKAIQMRFPVLLIDEAQDTSSLQWGIIDVAFPDGAHSIICSFGDSNQAIFQSYGAQEDGDLFPRGQPMSIGNSKRFSNKMAQLVNPLSIAQGNMTGEQVAFGKNDSSHTIFLYDRENIAAVLPTYAEHVLGCFTDDELRTNAELGCHAVGMVHNEKPLESSDKQFPKSVVDYWPEYNSRATSKVPTLYKLIEYFRVGEIETIQTGDVSKLTHSISRGLCRYINTNSDTRIFVSANAFVSMLKHVPVEEQNEFRVLFKRIIDSKYSTEDEWKTVVKMIHELVDTRFDIVEKDYEFLLWTPPVQSAGSGADVKHRLLNCFTYKSPETGRTVDIRLGSIHSVKGRTHLSTLVLETFWHNHNIASLLAWLCDEPQKKKPGVQIKKRLKCHYVALTRAKGLICLAIPKDLIDDETASKLTSTGWKVSYID